MKDEPAAGFDLTHRLRRTLFGGVVRQRDIVNHISLGSLCHTAQLLEDTGLRTGSSAFDWIFSSPSMVRACLADDFVGLLDRTQYESVPIAERPAPNECRCRHRLYAAHHGVPYVFNHHDPAASEVDYRFLIEGVYRLRTALDTPGTRNRFYLMAMYPTPDETVSEIAALLAAREAHNSLVFLQIVPGVETPRAIREAGDAPNLARVTVETRSTSIGMRFRDRADDAMLADLVRGLAVEA